MLTASREYDSTNRNKSTVISYGFFKIAIYVKKYCNKVEITELNTKSDKIIRWYYSFKGIC